MSRGCRILLAVLLTASTMIVAGRASAGAASTTTGGSRPITGLTARATGPNSVRLRWNRPLASATARIVVRRTTVGAADGRQHRYTVVLAARSATFLDLGTTAGTKYEYTVRTAAQQSPPESVRVRTPSAHPGPKWSAPVPADPLVGDVTAAACGSAQHCVLGDAHGYTSTFDGSEWSTPAATFDDAVTLLSCAGDSFCLAKIGFDQWQRLDGSAWSPIAVQTDLEANSLSCASEDLCAAGDWNGVATFDGSTWTTTALDSATQHSVSCSAGTTFCLEVDGDGYYATYSNGSWSTPVNIDPQPLDAVSCLPDQSCVAIDDNGRQLTYDGTTWTAPAGSGFQAVRAVSCASTTECVAVTKLGDFDNYIDGHAPNVSWGFDAAYTQAAISCLPGSSCLGASQEGSAATIDPSKESSIVDRRSVDPEVGGLSSLTCVSSTFCAAIHGATQLTVYRPSTGWQVSSPISDLPSQIACRTATWCIGVDLTNQRLVLLTGGPTDWTSTVVDTGHPYSAVACGAPSRCMAVAGDGRTAIFRDGGWHFTRATRRQHPFWPWVTCTRSFCMVEEPNGRAQITDGTSTRSVLAPGMYDVSCASATLCLGRTAVGLLRWDGMRWYAPSLRKVNDVECSSNRCVAVTFKAKLLTYSRNAWTSATSALPSSSAPWSDHVAAAPGGFTVASNSDGTVEMLPATTG